MNDSQSSYRQIVKATSIFGGVQVFQIIISVVRSKVIAILLGPAGMGIANLFNSTTGLIGGLTNFGIGTSAVKDVATNNAAGNQTGLSTVVVVLKRLVWITGILGALTTLLLSPWLSKLTFGSQDYTLGFIWISITLLFNQLTSGQLVILQGMRRLQYLAKSGIMGNLIGLLINIPLYYFYGIKGIVPAIIIASVVSMLIAWRFGSKVKIEPIRVSGKKTLEVGKNMITMGFVIALNGMIILATSYIVRIYISSRGGIGDVGLYSAGFSIINTYVGMIFTAMTTDYYPRLSSVADNNELCRQTINQQADIALLIVAPIIITFLVFINWVILILYSNKFIVINDMMLWAILGIFFKAASWPVGFIFIPKGDSRIFIINELTANAYMLSGNILGYFYFGLAGLGISFFVGYVIYFIQVFIVTHIRYGFAFSNGFLRLFSFQFLLAVICFVGVKVLGQPYSYLLGTLLILVSILYSFKELDKRLEIKKIVENIREKFLKK